MIGAGRTEAASGGVQRADAEAVPDFAELGVVAFTTTRLRGSFALQSTEPAGDVFARWMALADELAPHAGRLATAQQVHGNTVIVHEGSWTGWLRASAADAHVSTSPGTAMAVTVADCVPVFLAHPRGATAIVHSGWRGTVSRVTSQAIARLVSAGFSARELWLHCGPAICGRCYLVSPDVHAQLTGRTVAAPAPVDLRAIIASEARDAGVGHVSLSDRCTRCHNDRFFSHRCGDDGRQLGVIVRRELR